MDLMEGIKTVTISWGGILEFFGAVAVIGGGLKVLSQLLNPFKALEERLKKHDDMLDNDNKRLKDLTKILERLDEGQKKQGKAMIELLNHTITGNDTDKLKARKDELVEFYIDK